MKSLNIYVASSFTMKNRCEEIRLALVKEGHKVPDVWWNINTKEDFVGQSQQSFYASPLVQSIAVRHWKTIDTADALILVSDNNEITKFTGANVEVGYAIAKGIPVFSIGKLKLSAMYCPVIQIQDNTDELLKCINVLAQVGR